jgi:hypothetical protein
LLRRLTHVSIAGSSMCRVAPEEVPKWCPDNDGGDAHVPADAFSKRKGVSAVSLLRLNAHKWRPCSLETCETHDTFVACSVCHPWKMDLACALPLPNPPLSRTHSPSLSLSLSLSPSPLSDPSMCLSVCVGCVRACPCVGERQGGRGGVHV